MTPACTRCHAWFNSVATYLQHLLTCDGIRRSAPVCPVCGEREYCPECYSLDVVHRGIREEFHRWECRTCGKGGRV